MKKICEFCQREYEVKNKYSISGHLAKCIKFKSYKENILTKEYLTKEYLINGKSALEIAQEHNLLSASAIIKLLKIYKLKTRNISQSKNERIIEKTRKTHFKKYGKEHNFCKGHPSRLEWEERLFNEEGITNIFQRKEIIEVIKKKSKETKYRLGLAIRPHLKSDFEQYKGEVEKHSSKNYKNFNKIINPNNLKRCRGKYHLDHIYSKYDGFHNNVPAAILGHQVNLRMMLEHDNISKGKRSDITIAELYRRIIQYEFCESKINKET